MKYLFASLLLSLLMLGCGGSTPLADAQLITVYPTPNAHTASPVLIQASYSGAKQMAVVVDGVTITQVKTTSLDFTIPMNLGPHTVKIEGQGRTGPWATQTFTITVVPVLQIVPAAFPNATCTPDGFGGWLPAPYKQPIAITGGWPPYQFIPSTTTVPGLSITSDGYLAGNIDCLALYGMSGHNATARTVYVAQMYNRMFR